MKEESQDVLDVVYSDKMLSMILTATVEEGYSREDHIIFPHSLSKDFRGKMEMALFAYISLKLNLDKPVSVSDIAKNFHVSKKKVMKGIQQLIDRRYLQ